MNTHRSAIRLLKGERRLLIACKPAEYTLLRTYLSGLSSPEVVARASQLHLCIWCGDGSMSLGSRYPSVNVNQAKSHSCGDLELGVTTIVGVHFLLLCARHMGHSGFWSRLTDGSTSR